MMIKGLEDSLATYAEIAAAQYPVTASSIVYRKGDDEPVICFHGLNSKSAIPAPWLFSDFAITNFQEPIVLDLGNEIPIQNTSTIKKTLAVCGGHLDLFARIQYRITLFLFLELENENKEFSMGCAKKLIDLMVFQIRQQCRNESQLVFEKVFNLSNDLIFQGGLDGVFKKVNPAFGRILGWTDTELLTKPVSEFIHPDDRLASENELKRLADGKQTVQFIQRFRSKSGIYKMIEWTSTPTPQTGMIYGIGRDITRHSEMQQQLERTTLLLEKTARIAKVGGWEYDIMTKEIYWSAITREIHDVPEDYIPTLETAVQFYKEGKNRENIQRALEEASLQGTPWDLELVIIDYHGREKQVRAMGEAMFENGTLRKLWGTFQETPVR